MPDILIFTITGRKEKKFSVKLSKRQDVDHRTLYPQKCLVEGVKYTCIFNSTLGHSDIVSIVHKTIENDPLLL